MTSLKCQMQIKCMFGLIAMHLSEYTDVTKSLKKLTTQIGDIGCVAGVRGVDAGWLLWNNIRDRRLIHGKVGSSQNAAEAH